MESEKQQDKAVRRVTWIGFFANLLLMAFKFFAGVVGNSAAMIADAAHSASDLASDIVVLIGLRISAQPRDKTHPYGHGKVETSVAVLVGMMLIGVGGFIFWEGAQGLYLNIEKTPGFIALLAALFSIVVKEILYQITLRAGRKAGRPSVIANAWHHRSDAFSSVAALAGIGGNMLGVSHLDQLAGMVVALIVVHVGFKIAWEAYKDLIDTAVETKFQTRLIDTVRHIDGVRGYHKLRTRKVGMAIFVDIHIEVDGNLSMRAGHAIADRVEHTLIDKLKVDDVTVHVDIADET
ncbi:MAG TPA: cation diffusion facilitator family transporter [bacterium]|nr:cation diffusion facilitator family transporter [bacterium]